MAALLAAPAGAATISSTTMTPLVDNFADDSICSLREMVQIANLNDEASVESDCDVTGTPLAPGGSDTINLATGTYAMNTVGAEDASPDDNEQGDIDIGDSSGGDLTIAGAGPASTSIAETTGMPSTRVLDVQFGSLKLDFLTVTSGVASVAADLPDGGGIYFASGSDALELHNVTVNMNFAGAGGNGGGIYVGNTTSSLDSGANSMVANNSAAAGGGISAAGSVDLSALSTVSDNTATSSGGGIVLFGTGELDLDHATVFNNHVSGGVTGAGGGIYISSAASENHEITDSAITSNDAVSTGGGIFMLHSGGGKLAIADSKVNENDAGAPASAIDVYGGGIFLLDGELELLRTAVQENGAESTMNGAGGGGIAAEFGNDQEIRATDSVIENNTATTSSMSAGTTGGGILAADGRLELFRTTVANNKLSGPVGPAGIQSGAGISSGPNDGEVLMVNSTVSGNEAPKVGATTDGIGGGLYVYDGTSGDIGGATIIASTFAGNRAGNIGGVPDPGDSLMTDGSQNPVVNIRGSIVQGLDDPTFAPEEACDSPMGTIVSGGRNVTLDPACFTTAGPGDLQGTNPMLGMLADNGGPMVGSPGSLIPLFTRALLPGSPALDLVPVGACLDEASAPLLVDQRGSPRPPNAGGACDAGAFETFVPLPPPAVIPATPVTTSPPVTPPAATKKCKKGRKLVRKKGKLKCKKKKKRKK